VATLAVAGFLCFSQLMFASGMTLALAEAVAAATGRGYVLLLPLVGALGGFLTASNAGSNAMFAGFQEAMAARLELPEDLMIAAQNASGANTTLASPGRVVLAAAVTGLTGREGALMRPALALAAGGLAGLAILLWLWIG
jgi:lactate permease